MARRAAHWACRMGGQMTILEQVRKLVNASHQIRSVTIA